MTNKKWGWLIAAVGVLLMCNGDVRCAIRRTLSL